MDALTIDDILGAIGILTSVGAAAVLVLRQRQVVRALEALLPRLPIALRNTMSRIPAGEAFMNASGRPRPDTDCPRGAQQRTCVALLDYEEFNHGIFLTMSRLRDATTYPLKSRVAVVAFVLWLLVAVLVAAFYFGNPGVRSGTDQNGVTNTANAATGRESPGGHNVVGEQTLTGNYRSAQENAASRAVPRVVSLILLVAASFSAILIGSFHFGVYVVLVDDVLTQCETIGLVTTRTTNTGEVVFDDMIDSGDVGDDPGFRQLLRLSKRG